jgi:hypothetical protein
MPCLIDFGDCFFFKVVNAHVRCGDIPGAVSRLEQAKAAGRKPCVVLYTSLLKVHSMHQCIVQNVL